MAVAPLRRDECRVYIFIIMRQADLLEMIGHLLERTILFERFIAKCDICVEDTFC